MFTNAKANNDGSTVILKPGTYTFSDISNYFGGSGDSAIVVNFKAEDPDAGNVIIDGGGTARILLYTHVNFEGITFQNMKGLNYCGGAVSLQGPSGVVFRKCKFLNTIATANATSGNSRGGAVFGINLKFYDCVFSNCIASSTIVNGTNGHGEGGAIYYAYGSTEGTIENCEFYDCHADKSGGAVAAINDCTLTVKNSKFYRNTITNYSSLAVASARSNRDNSAYGGAIWQRDSGKLFVEGCQFNGNQARYGGAIYRGNATTGTPSNPYFTVKNSKFENNTARAGLQFMLAKERGIIDCKLASAKTRQFNALAVRMKVTGAEKATCALYWKGDEAKLGEAASARLRLMPDGEFHDYRIPLAEKSEWKGKVDYLRLDPEATLGAKFTIEHVELEKAKQ